MSRTYRPATIEMVASVLSAQMRTPRQIEALLPFDLHRTTVRGVLHLLVRAGRAQTEGDVMQRRYCLSGTAQ